MSDEFPVALAELLKRSPINRVELIQALKQHPILARCLAAPLGGVDELTLEAHTLNALAVYERYFEHRSLALMSRSSFKLLLALHDLGKPNAVAERRPAEQHVITLRLIRENIEPIADLNAELSKIEVLIDGDPIGSCLNRKQHVPMREAAVIIAQGAERLSAPIRDYWECLLVYYQCDAAAYPSLSAKVFVSDSSGAPQFSPELGRFVFRDGEEAGRFETLERYVLHAQPDWP